MLAIDYVHYITYQLKRKPNILTYYIFFLKYLVPKVIHCHKQVNMLW